VPFPRSNNALLCLRPGPSKEEQNQIPRDGQAALENVEDKSHNTEKPLNYV